LDTPVEALAFGRTGGWLVVGFGDAIPEKNSSTAESEPEASSGGVAVLNVNDGSRRNVPPIGGAVVDADSAVESNFLAEIEHRQERPGDDLLSMLLHSEVDGAPVEQSVVLGTAALVLIAGVDTTWSAIGSSLWHLAAHPEDRKRLTAEPELMPFAIEELLRAYSPVTMARVVTEDVEFAHCPMKAGDRILMNFPAANRDPEAFEDADKVVLDRALNRHVAFGSGIHRCAGSNLARMELRVALEEWLRRIPEFHLDEAEEVAWAGGQVRGPRVLPVVFP